MITYNDIDGSELHLRDLLDRPSVEEMARFIRHTFNFDIMVLSRDGEIHTDIPKSGGFALYLKQDKNLQKAWKRFIVGIARLRIQKSKIVERLFAGQLHFVIVPVQKDFDVLGTLVLGPFGPNEKAGSLKKASRRQKSFAGPPYSKAHVQRMGELLMGIFDVLVFNSYKGLLTNITHLRTMTDNYNEVQEKNRELKKSFEQLKELDKIKSNFLAMISHELRTPLTSVIGYSEMLLDGIAGELNQGQVGYIKIILEKADHLLNLIKQVINLSKIEAGKMKANLERANLREIVGIAIESVQITSAKRNIKINVHFDSNVPEMVALDREKVDQIFMQLLNNAVKFNVDDGQIDINLEIVPEKSLIKLGRLKAKKRGVGQWLLCSVKDSGIGIPEQMTHKIFDKFFQIDNSSTREFEGTGLGLALVKNFIEMHDGLIWARSRLPKGTEIIFALPLRPVI